MQIKAHILANRAQEVPIPIPIEPVEATITTVGNIGYSYYARNDQLSPAGEAYLETVRGFQMQSAISSGEYYASQGYDCPPCNCGGNGSGEDVTLHHDVEALWNGRHYIATEDHLFTTSGSFKLTIGNTLPAGRYVFEITHFLGVDTTDIYDNDVPRGRVIPIGNRGTVIKSGTHGVIEAKVFPEETVYTGKNGRYGGRVISVRMRYAFTIAEGDTEKIFTWGDNGDISMRELWDYLLMYEQNRNQVKEGYLWLNSHFTLRAKVYKGA